MDSLQISTGQKRIPIIRDGINAGELVFNPNDAVLAEKFYLLIGKLNAISKELKSAAQDIEANATDEMQAGLEATRFAQKAHASLCAEYDNLFGPGTSAKVFGDFVPLTDEGFAVHEQFVEGFAPYFQKARAEKIQKYTGTNGKSKRKRK